jgi:hypothetical protein
MNMPLVNFPTPSEVPVRRKGAGTWKSENGYIYEYCPEHPRCNNSGGVFQHRLVMEMHLGRFLSPKEVVHHVNEQKDDNRLENLQVMENTSAHSSLHQKQWAKIYNPAFVSAVIAAAADPKISLQTASKKLKCSHETIRKTCKLHKIRWKFVPPISIPKEHVLRILQAHPRKEACKILGVSLESLWRLYPQEMNMTANPNRIKSRGLQDVPERFRQTSEP